MPVPKHRVAAATAITKTYKRHTANLIRRIFADSRMPVM
jgi:hypothetical protein